MANSWALFRINIFNDVPPPSKQRGSSSKVRESPSGTENHEPYASRGEAEKLEHAFNSIVALHSAAAKGPCIMTKNANAC